MFRRVSSLLSHAWSRVQMLCISYFSRGKRVVKKYWRKLNYVERVIEHDVEHIEKIVAKDIRQAEKAVVDEVIVVEKTLIRIWVENHIEHIIVTGILILIMLIASFFWRFNHAEEGTGEPAPSSVVVMENVVPNDE